MLGIVIGEKSCWNQGYGQEALVLLLDYAFNLLNLNSVMLGVFSFNQRGAASYRKVGFREIGQRRQARILGGQNLRRVDDGYSRRRVPRAASQPGAGRARRAAAPLTIRMKAV